ncbi:MAG: SsrA-binding protein SmpB [Candidatus Eisenbacteria bacterium]|nr:SsrA-binding protein SmpB [Candidatus Eisenbacteria bacterium]
MSGEKKDAEVRVVARNRRATYLYEILDRIEAGLVLQGSEVKSLRAGKVSLADAYAAPRGEEFFLHNLRIPPYDKASIDPPDPVRRRKLLLQKRQIRKLLGKVKERGLTLIPLRIYFRDGYAKVELGLARGKRKFDKRQAIAKKDLQRDIERARGGRGV